MTKDLRNSLLYLLLFIVLILGAIIIVNRTGAESEVIVVHTGESQTLMWNPETHEEVRTETPDGNVMLTVQPKKEDSWK